MQNSALRIRHHSWQLGRVAVVVSFCLLKFAFCIPGAAAQQPNFLTGFGPAPLTPAGVTPAALKDVTFKQQLNSRIPFDAAFVDDTGRQVTLGQYFGGTKPVVLAFV